MSHEHVSESPGLEPRRPEGLPRAPKILVVDQGEVDRQVMMDVLLSAGYEVVGAASASQALKLFDARVRCLVTDLELPDRSGIDLAGRIRTLCCDLPILIVTGAPTEDKFRAMRKSGIDAVLFKPIQAAELVDAVRRLVGPAD